MKRFRGGLVFEAHILLYHSTLGLKVKTKRGLDVIDDGAGGADGRRDQSVAECVHEVSKTRAGVRRGRNGV